ncbi:MAG: hydrolase, partial [Mesorhizobium sp.]
SFSADHFDFTPRSVTWAQAAFLKRFAALEAKRQPFLAANSVK